MEKLAAAVAVPLKTALYVWIPIEGMIFRVAFPVPLANCAFPKIAASSHRFADASQKAIDPFVTGAPPAVTVTEAVKVTGVCHATGDGERVSIVVVGSGATCAAATLQATVNRADRTSRRLWRRGEAIRLQAAKNKFHI
jgi:cellulase/cellobiase CelA1